MKTSIPGQLSQSAAADDNPPLFRKIAWRILPLLVLCYLSAFMDRVNVGFAAASMREDIGLTATAFGIGSGVFFLSYFLLEIPSNLALTHFGARRWIARIMVSWGILSALTAFAWNGPSFITLRLLLGAAEAGFYPGVLLYLTQWFPEKKRAQFIGYFILANPLATVIGAPLSGWLLSTGGFGGLKGWQLMFLVEAVPAVLLGIVTFFCLPDRISDARWLSDDEKRQVTTQLQTEATRTVHRGRIDLRQVFMHPRILGLSFIFLSISMTNATVNFWLPQIIKSSGFSTYVTGWISAIPYVAAVGSLLFWGHHSDRTGERRYHILIPMLAAAACIAAAGFHDLPLVRILGFTIASAGLFAALPIYWSLPGRFLVGNAAAGGIAFINSVGNLGGFIGPSAMGYLKDATGSFGGGLLLDSVALILGAAVVMCVTSRQPAGH
ncbi:MFS transporter [Burkholderia gladioli]|uniref:MFS transporter n=1 Tax=Burkholderia gladioli TaxID=28095 RepID=UPI001640F22B|nr:MFS transporter [Burkholderia gladioli]